MSDQNTYKHPTKKDVEKTFGKQLTAKSVKMRKCNDVRNFISKLQKAYSNTKKTSLHFK